MMMNRDRLSFWVRLVAILLAAVFLISFIFLGIGTNVQYNIFDLFGNQDQHSSRPDQTPDHRTADRRRREGPEKGPEGPGEDKGPRRPLLHRGPLRRGDPGSARGTRGGPERRGDTGVSGPDLQPAGADRDWGRRRRSCRIRRLTPSRRRRRRSPTAPRRTCWRARPTTRPASPPRPSSTTTGTSTATRRARTRPRVEDRISALLEGKESGGGAQP